MDDYLTLPDKTTNELNELATLHQVLIGQTSYLSPGGTATTDLKYQLDVKQPWVDEPQGSIPIDTQNGIDIPAVAVNVWVNVVNVLIPAGWDAIIDGINCNFTSNAFTEFSGDIIWRLTVDGRPVEGFQAIKNQRGSVEQTRKIHTLKVKNGSVVAIDVQHAANGALGGNIIAGIYGYRYPRIGSV